MSSVAAIVVTRNRREQLLCTLDALAEQLVPIDKVIVVDNASDDGSAAAASAFSRFPVEVLPMTTNLGAAGGRGKGMSAAVQQGFDLCWVVDDDSEPNPHALERLDRARSAIGHCGMVGVRGGYRRWGVIRRIRSGPGPHPVRHADLAIGLVDFVHIDSALVDSNAVRECGLPRADYFIMMEDVEYPLRIKDAGWRIGLLAEDVVDLKHLGSTGPWRLYYQTRNELLMARDRGELRALFGWVVRSLTFVYGHLRHSDGRWIRLRFRAKGAADGLRNVRGRVVEPPPQPSPG
ncbi:MAG: glycosyltransferase [Actinobacteria bacterium]|nr:glycosyltransferase [Actinomycetota bacterium]